MHVSGFEIGWITFQSFQTNMLYLLTDFLEYSVGIWGGFRYFSWLKGLVRWSRSLSLSLFFTWLRNYNCTISLAWNVWKYCPTLGRWRGEIIIIFLPTNEFHRYKYSHGTNQKYVEFLKCNCFWFGCALVPQVSS